jgi:hypothetical protein
MIGIKKHGVGFENRLGPFSLHDASRFNLEIPTETRNVHFLYSSSYGLVTEMARVACGPRFFGHS